jgi:hypothetical protein
MADGPNLEILQSDAKLEPKPKKLSKKPRSAAQKEQSRINGAKSKGPKTAEGKAISSKNSIRHGLTANCNTLLEGESRAEYDIVYNAWTSDLRPMTQAELRLVERIANLDWRQERLIMMETALLNVELGIHDPAIQARWKSIDDIGVLADAWKGSADTSHSLDLLRRYMVALQSQFNATLKNFRNLERARTDPRRIRDLDIEPPYRAPALFPEPEEPTAGEHVEPEPEIPQAPMPASNPWLLPTRIESERGSSSAPKSPLGEPRAKRPAA